MPAIDGLVKQLRGLIREELEKVQTAQVFVVTGVNVDRYTVQIKSPIKALQFDDVKIAGIGLGNYRGIMKLPNVGDWVLVTFLGGNQLQPIIIGNMFDQFTQSPDNLPSVAVDQLVLIGKEAGSFLSLNADNSVILRSVDSAGNPDNGARFRLNPDGSFKLFNKNNYGIECDANGNITLRGVTINNTQTAGTWP